MTGSALSRAPRMVFCDAKGDVFVHPSLKALGFDGQGFVLPVQEEWVSLPAGSSFFYLPGHRAFGFDPLAGKAAVLEEIQGRGVYPAAGFMVPGYTRLYLPAARKTDPRLTLPLWPYTAVGYAQGKFVAAAVRIDGGRKQRPFYYADRPSIVKGIRCLSRKYSSNRLLKHLGHCALQYNCRNAQNLFLGRWEAPLPVSPLCNSRCLGCLSAQDTDCSSSHSRIRFVPSAGEVAEIAIHHLKHARAPIVSFGQGCEGEPLLEVDVLKEAIIRMRRATKRGTIHLNSNGCDAARIRALAACGLDSVRISINSFHPRLYGAYYRPRGYAFSDVIASIKEAKSNGLFVSLNYLTFPGFTDDADDVARLVSFLKKGNADLLQLRNLCIDPEVFSEKMALVNGRPVGILRMIRRIRQEVPRLRLGYFNLPKENFRPSL
ncbi:MAG: radical SAM protein [Candidatus Velamenicoccus archaeovorus]